MPRSRGESQVASVKEFIRVQRGNLMCWKNSPLIIVSPLVTPAFCVWLGRWEQGLGYCCDQILDHDYHQGRVPLLGAAAAHPQRNK